MRHEVDISSLTARLIAHPCGKGPRMLSLNLVQNPLGFLFWHLVDPEFTMYTFFAASVQLPTLPLAHAPFAAEYICKMIRPIAFFECPTSRQDSGCPYVVTHIRTNWSSLSPYADCHDFARSWRRMKIDADTHWHLTMRVASDFSSLSTIISTSINFCRASSDLVAIRRKTFLLIVVDTIPASAYAVFKTYDIILKRFVGFLSHRVKLEIYCALYLLVLLISPLE